MSTRGREQLINEIVRKYGEQAETPAREVAQAYEAEMQELEREFEIGARELENTAAQQQAVQSKVAENRVWANFFGGLGFGISAALFGYFDLLLPASTLWGAAVVCFGIAAVILISS